MVNYRNKNWNGGHSTICKLIGALESYFKPIEKTSLYSYLKQNLMYNEVRSNSFLAFKYHHDKWKEISRTNERTIKQANEREQKYVRRKSHVATDFHCHELWHTRIIHDNQTKCVCSNVLFSICIEWQSGNFQVNNSVCFFFLSNMLPVYPHCIISYRKTSPILGKYQRQTQCGSKYTLKTTSAWLNQFASIWQMKWYFVFLWESLIEKFNISTHYTFINSKFTSHLQNRLFCPDFWMTFLMA